MKEAAGGYSAGPPDGDWLVWKQFQHCQVGPAGGCSAGREHCTQLAGPSAWPVGGECQAYIIVFYLIKPRSLKEVVERSKKQKKKLTREKSRIIIIFIE